jgi:uncharacterized protein YbjT (DUF2867 family)
MRHMARVLVTGATGYIGGRLVPRLLDDPGPDGAGWTVRVLARDPARLRDVPWLDRVEVARGDVLDAASLRPALAGVDVAYYLVHSLTAPDVEERDRRAAQTFADAAREAGVRRIVYLGGLSPALSPTELSPHLRSRAEVGDVLLESGVPTAVLRAAVIIGSGSASFEMLRYLTERLPAMLTPRWVTTRVQPIAVRDVMRDLLAAATLPADVNRTFDIGGPDVLTYAEMMQCYAQVAGLHRRVIVRVPWLTPGLSAHWVNVVTPVPASIARPLIESLRNEVVCHENDLHTMIGEPPEGLTGVADAIRLALARVRADDVETSWATATVGYAPSDPLPASAAAWGDEPSDPLPTDPAWSGGSRYTDARRATIAADPDQVGQVIQRIGAENGWYTFGFGWRVRGVLDRLVGGVGMRPRRDRTQLRVGDAVDWWRVEEIDPPHLLRLRAEMKMPGRGWLELGVTPESGGGTSTYTQRALFYPLGLLGHAYWWALVPFHAVVFGGTVRAVRKRAELEQRRSLASPGRAVEPVGRAVDDGTLVA